MAKNNAYWSARRLAHKHMKEQLKADDAYKKRIARLYPQFKEGDVLNEEFIEGLSEEDQDAADQINRRTEFQVLSFEMQ